MGKVEWALQMARDDLAREPDNMIPVNITRDALSALVGEITRLQLLVGAASSGESLSDIKQGLRIKNRAPVAGTNIGDGVALSCAPHPNDEESD